MEVDVAMNMVKHNDFDRGVTEVLMKPKSKGGMMRKNPGFQQAVSDSEIDRFFEPSPESKSINIETVKYALLPTRHFYNRFSDHLRLWMNE